MICKQRFPAVLLKSHPSCTKATVALGCPTPRARAGDSTHSTAHPHHSPQIVTNHHPLPAAKPCTVSPQLTTGLHYGQTAKPTAGKIMCTFNVLGQNSPQKSYNTNINLPSFFHLFYLLLHRLDVLLPVNRSLTEMLREN